MAMMKRKIAVTMNCCRGYPFEEALAGIKAAGFEYVELTCSEKAGDIIHINRTIPELDAAGKLIVDAGLIPLALSGHTDFFADNAESELIRKADLADYFGCRYINTFIGSGSFEESGKAVKVLRTLAPVLERRNITLCLELHGRYATADAVSYFKDAAESDNVMINYDTANCIFYGGVNAEDDMISCLDSIGYMHIKDKTGRRDEWNFPALGEGYVDFKSIFSQINSTGRNVPCSVEIEFTPSGTENIHQVNEALEISHRYLVDNGFHLYE